MLLCVHLIARINALVALEVVPVVPGPALEVVPGVRVARLALVVPVALVVPGVVPERVKAGVKEVVTRLAEGRVKHHVMMHARLLED